MHLQVTTLRFRRTTRRARNAMSALCGIQPGRNSWLWPSKRAGIRGGLPEPRGKGTQHIEFDAREATSFVRCAKPMA